jgi:hypothetical protein
MRDAHIASVIQAAVTPTSPPYAALKDSSYRRKTMLQRTKRMAVAVFIAGAALGGIAPAATAENYIWRDADRIMNRDADRVMNRDVGRVADVTADTVDGTADFAGDAVRYAARELRNILNPR